VNLLRAAAGISALTMLSRITGLVRDLLIARVFGAGIETDAYTVAFRLPNLLRRLFAEGAFSQAFAPLFVQFKVKEGEERTRELLSSVFSALFWVLLAVSIAGVLAAPALVSVIATGFRGSEAFDLATLLTRWMFPYIFFMSLVACAAGALNAYGRFSVPAFTPVLLNVSIIGLVLLLGRRLEPPVLVLGLAVLLGGMLQLAIQLPALARIGMLPRLRGLRRALSDAGVRRILSQMVPALFAVSVAQLSLVINTNIASRLGAGSNSWLYYADRLMELPTALLGVALGTVLLPSLSAAHAGDDAPRYSRLLDWGLRLTLVLALPAALGLGLLSEGLMATLFSGGRFGEQDVVQSAAALRGYAAGLVGLIGIKILAPGFYARQDIRTPVKIGIAVLVATQIANLALVPWLAHAGLAWSISLGALANAVLLFAGLRRRGTYLPSAGWGVFLLRLAVSLAALVGAILALRAFFPAQVHAGIWARATWLVVVVGGAAGAYALALLAVGIRPGDFRQRA